MGRYAASDSRDCNSNCAAPTQLQLAHISSDVEALVWALGCIWSTRAERILSRIHPAVNCALLLLGLCLAVEVLMARLAWYGVPPRQLDFHDESLRGLAKFGAFIVAVALVGLTAPGRPRRRIFAAALFPFLGLLGLFATASAFQFAVSVRLPDDYPAAESVLRGLSVGLIVALVLSIPAALLYRSTAVPISALALLPSIAKASWTAVQPYTNFDAGGGLFWFGWPFICSLVLIAIFTHLCRRWLGLGPLPR